MELVVACECIDPDDLHVTFDDIGSHAQIKKVRMDELAIHNEGQALHQLVILPFENPELFSSPLLRPPKGILLCGVVVQATG